MRLIIVNLIVGIGILIGCCVRTTLAAEPVTTQPSTQPLAQPGIQTADEKKQMEEFWADLEKDEPWCSRAILDFYDKPAQSVSFFKEHLTPLKIEDKDLDDALAALASDDEKVWKPAFDKLKYYDPRLNRSVDQLMADITDPNARVRLAALLTGNTVEKWKGFDVSYQNTGTLGYVIFSKNGSRSMYQVRQKISDLSPLKKEWMRDDRALVILQRIGSPDAISILKDMATGNPDAQSTNIAKAALDSLGQSVK